MKCFIDECRRDRHRQGFCRQHYGQFVAWNSKASPRAKVRRHYARGWIVWCTHCPDWQWLDYSEGDAGDMGREHLTNQHGVTEHLHRVTA